MITTWDIYWITRLDSIPSMLGVICCFGVFVLFFMGVYWNVVKEINGVNTVGKLRLPSIIFACVVFSSVAVSHLLPTTKEAVAIFTVPAIVNNEDMREVPQNMAKFLNAKLQEWINENIGEVTHD